MAARRRGPFYAPAVLCSDDPHVRSIMASITKSIVTYGTSEDAQVRAAGITQDGGRMRFTAVQRGSADVAVTLNLPGLHNVLNACATIAVAREVGVNNAAIAKAVAEFTGVGRRFQRFGELAPAGGGALQVGAR